MSEELFCLNCGHSIEEHGAIGCTHMHGVNLWCRCKYSACGINLDWLKHEYQSLKSERDALKAGLDVAMEAIKKARKYSNPVGLGFLILDNALASIAALDNTKSNSDITKSDGEGE